MNTILDVALQELGLRDRKATPYDLQLQKLQIDGLGRTLPMSGQAVGAAPVSWLGAGQADLATTGYANHGIAFSVISYILSTAAPLPWAAYTLDDQDNRAQVVPQHPLADLLYRPNPRQNWAELKTQAEGGYLVSGECFLRRVVPRAGSKRGKTAEIWCLVGRVELLPLTGLGQFDAPTGYRHHDLLTGAVTDYPAEEILHLKTYNPLNPHRGLSPLAAGNDALTAAKSGLESRVRQYQNQGPPGIVYVKPGDSPLEDFTSAQASGIQRWFDSFRPGRRREGNLPVLTGDLGYLKLGLSPVDMDVLEALPHDKDLICDLLRFPGQLLNGSKGTTFSNMGEAGAALYSRCVIPLEAVMRDGLNRWLGPEHADAVYLDYDTSHVPELQPNKEKLAAWLKDAWFVSVPERQRMLGVPVDWEGPKFLIPMNLVPADELPLSPSADAAPAAGEAMN